MANHPNRSTDAKVARAYVAARPGVERVRIIGRAVVQAYGTMPNTAALGWYLAGYVAELAMQARAERDPDA